MIQPKNYATHAAEDTSKFLAGGVFGQGVDASNTSMILQDLHSSTKFILPPYGRFEVSTGACLPDELWLPYDIVTLEYEADRTDHLDPKNQFKSSRRIIMLKTSPHMPGAVIGTHFWYSDDIGKWTMSGFGSIIQMVDDDHNTVIFKEDGHGEVVRNSNGLRLSMSLWYPHPEFAKRQYDKKGKESVTKDATSDLKEEVLAAAFFIEALTCHNVRAETLVEEPTKLNKKRMKKMARGDLTLPFYAYKMLVVDLSKISKRYQRSDSEPTGRQMPEHTRIGHIRHFRSDRFVNVKGKTTYIPSCVVGCRAVGTLNKDYILK